MVFVPTFAQPDDESGWINWKNLGPSVILSFFLESPT